MGVVTVSSSASRAATTLPVRFVSRHRLSPTGPRPASIVAFKTDRSKCSAVAATTSHEPTTIPLQQLEKESRPRKNPNKARSKKPKKEKADTELDYNEVAAALENIYKLSPGADVADAEGFDRKRRRDLGGGENINNIIVVRNRKRRARRLSLDKRVERKRRSRDGEIRSSFSEQDGEEEEEDVERLVREYSVSSTDLVSLDWKKMKIPPVLSSSEQARLFKLMQPMKAIFEVKENLHNDLNKELTEGELAAAVNMTVPQLRRHIEVGQAARNKLIKHNLRLVLFVINKYYQEIASGDKFQDLCQAGVKGLITAIDRFEPKRGFRLSTYGLFWIRHSIIRSMTTSSFTRVPFGIESVRQEIQKAKLELMCELQRLPTEEEIISRVGISPERYHDVMKASKSVYSLNSRHVVTQEEFINAITDIDGVGGDKRRQPALLRLALDDVLDSLKPKESLVIRQRYGLDGKGNRTLGEIAGNLNISREMVRKHELKALMKLKHPARLDYLRRYI